MKFDLVFLAILLPVSYLASRLFSNNDLKTAAMVISSLIVYFFVRKLIK